MGLLIGIDFDNTIASYDDILHKIAVSRGLILQDTPKTKKEIRDGIRRLPHGDIGWQRLQSIVYGSRMEEAKLMDGVQTFLDLCKRHKIPVRIVSHKTQYANFDETRTNLRVAALNWMKANRFFDSDGLGLFQSEVYFESTRLLKIERIRSLGCTHFVDDLEETFLEASFPANIEKILYAPHPQSSYPHGVKVFTSWKEISGHFFAAV